jgi:imidazolonepropionase-like amidohydrolase
MKKLFLLIMLAGSTLLQGQSTQKTLYLNAIIHIGNGQRIAQAYMTVIGNKIGTVSPMAGLSYNPSDFDTVIDLRNKHIWPGIIALNTTIGLREIDAVRSTLDDTETGELNPNVRALVAYNTDSKIIPTLRSNGVLTVQSVPRGKLLSGSSSLFHTNGWNWEDAALKADDGLHIFWPESSFQRSPADTTRSNEKAIENIRKLESLFTEAKNANANHIKLASVKKVLSGKMALYIHAEQARDIADALVFGKKFEIPRLVLVGGSDCWMVAGLLKKYRVPVVLSRLHRLPSNPDEPVDLPFRMPAILRDSGIIVALSYEGGMAANVRNLSFVAGTAAAYGLNQEDALRMITLNPAIIAGVDQTDGSLESGKNATFLITSGDILDMRTARVEEAYIAGQKLSLDDLHKQLYIKFRNKYQPE